jgi:hypothetical protein
MTKGILLLATTHPYYGRMAHNLAVSIKATGTQIPICVLHSGRGLSHLNDRQKEIFDHVIEIPQSGFAAKLWLYRHSPFQKTLFIDADTAWLPKRKPEELFDQLAESKFEAIVEGFVDLDGGPDSVSPRYKLWADLEQTKKAYPIKEKLYQFRSEVMYFKKDNSVSKMFTDAIKIQERPKIDVTLFGGVVPDEFALNVAASMNGIIPGVDFKPSYWYNLTKKTIPLPVLSQQFYVLSAGGNTVSAGIKKMYDTVMGAAFYKMKLQYLFTLQPKRNSIAERNLI